MAQILYQPAHGGDSVLILIAGEHSMLRQYQPLDLLTTFGRSFNEDEDRAHFTVGKVRLIDCSAARVDVMEHTAIGLCSRASPHLVHAVDNKNFDGCSSGFQSQA
jgi:hypothetical protein